MSIRRSICRRLADIETPVYRLVSIWRICKARLDLIEESGALE